MMPKYFFWCGKCKQGFATKFKPEEIRRRDSGVSCGAHKPAEPMENLGAWPEGLAEMNRRKNAARKEKV